MSPATPMSEGDQVTDEKEFFEKSTKDYVHVDPEIIDPELIRALKVNRDDLFQLYAKLIANPYLAPNLVGDIKANLMNTVGTLIEYGVPIDAERKIRTPDDVIKEGMMELGGMLGAKAFTGAMKAKKAFTETLQGETQVAKVFKDPDDGSYYYIDASTGEEIDCDIDGNPLE